MNLVIDAGNTYIKIGIFDDSSIISKEIIELQDFSKTIKRIKKDHPAVTQVILSSVSNINSQSLKQLGDLFSTLLILNHDVQVPFKNLYSTPTTLGVDRIALVAAAVEQYPGRNTLIIDAGTCITYDFKNNKEEYLGGAIAPGIRLRYNSLNNHTANLPLLERKEPKNYIGRSTEESIHSGVVHGIVNEIDGVISQYCNTYTDLTVILTGGDAHFLSKRLKNSIFATSNFLLEGLNYILAFNNSQ